MITQDNLAELSVSEISGLIKKTIDINFSYVKIRGEISGLKLAASRHLYFSLKDETAVMSAVMWRGKFEALDIKLEDGMEVVCYGSITTFSGQSKYQMIVEKVELAGIGALMQKLEALKKQLANEGLFDPAHKKPIPKFPKVIGVITSQTGAVIKDILHRIEERYPTEVYLFPALVQGDKCVEDIINAIEKAEKHPEIDTLIIARGGGSFEDLWHFNDERIVRKVFNCNIPVISAIGHETDFTLLDYVADLRAPTPTAAAEFATPDRTELRSYIIKSYSNIANNVNNQFSLINNKLTNLALKLPKPNEYIENQQNKLESLFKLGKSYINQAFERNIFTLTNLSTRLSPELLNNNIKLNEQRLNTASEKLEASLAKTMEMTKLKLEGMSKMLDSYNYANVLKRGYTVVRDASNKLVTKAESIEPNQVYNVEFADGIKYFIATNGDD